MALADETWYRTLTYCQLAKLSWADYVCLPLLFTECINLSPAPEAPSTAVGLVEHCLECIIVVLAELHEVVGRSAHDQSSSVIEAAEPELTRMVTHTDRHDVPIFRSWMGLVAHFTSPLALVQHCHLLVATFGQTGRIAPGGFLSNEDNRCLEGEIVRLVRHAQLFLADLRNSFERIRLHVGVGCTRQ